MLSSYEQKLLERLVKRKMLFKWLSIISVVIALSLACFYTWQYFNQNTQNVDLHFVVIILILLNARQNLRQHNLARILERSTQVGQ